ncbi:hypothetical protein RRG46_01555 [Mycoplasmopsis cynos]|uniref:Uncharacterized protein n=1 Tax=Mycoplasmopsis cynos TaxID=171284 RepID=A0ABD8AJP9_9BACT|nr:hypothetical protein [Mycoplasmopsis cynos]WQQ20216.1 hypothetical protein RRG46_01555 [Mycoplasmopsis cynos]
MRKNKNNTRILRHHNDEIDPKKEGLRYKRFLGKNLNIENDFLENSEINFKKSCKTEQKTINKPIKETNIMSHEKTFKPEVQKSIKIETKLMSNEPQYLSLAELSVEYWNFFKDLMKS